MTNIALETEKQLRSTDYNQKFFDTTRETEVLDKQNKFVDLLLKHENLVPFQTPFRITSPKMKEWTTIHGFPINQGIIPPKGRENFIYLSRQEDLIPAVKQQFINYMTKPNKYGLPENPTIKDAIKKFDQTGAKGKLDFLKTGGIDTNMLLSELFNAQK